jgi:hypothetical protein
VELRIITAENAGMQTQYFREMAIQYHLRCQTQRLATAILAEVIAM